MEMKRRWISGFTLLELMMAVVMVAILAAIALPSYQSLRQEQMVRAATQALYTDMMLLKSEAIKRNKNLSLIVFNSGLSNWCYRIVIDGTCTSCADDCSSLEGRKGADASEFGGVVIDASGIYKTGTGTTANISFNARRGSLKGGHFTISNASNTAYKVTIASYGRISTSPCTNGVSSC